MTQEIIYCLYLWYYLLARVIASYVVHIAGGDCSSNVSFRSGDLVNRFEMLERAHLVRLCSAAASARASCALVQRYSVPSLDARDAAALHKRAPESHTYLSTRYAQHVLGFLGIPSSAYKSCAVAWATTNCHETMRRSYSVSWRFRTISPTHAHALVSRSPMSVRQSPSPGPTT